MNDETSQKLYAGLSGVRLTVDRYELGHGVELRQTYAHFMSPRLVAFKRADPGKPHPAPWKAAQGGFAFDVEVELSVPLGTALPAGLRPEDCVAWLSALIRLSDHPYMEVPTLADRPFDVALATNSEGSVWPNETERRMLRRSDEGPSDMTPEQLGWIKERWIESAPLYARDPKFRLALIAIDACTLRGKVDAALLGVWGALEQIFLPSRNELRYRIASNIAAYLEEPGEPRLKLFKEVLSLYDSRSRAAHSSTEGDTGALVASFVIARNAIIRIVGDGALPTQENLERRLFLAGAHPPANTCTAL